MQARSISYVHFSVVRRKFVVLTCQRNKLRKRDSPQSIDTYFTATVQTSSKPVAKTILVVGADDCGVRHGGSNEYACAGEARRGDELDEGSP